MSDTRLWYITSYATWPCDILCLLQCLTNYRHTYRHTVNRHTSQYLMFKSYKWITYSVSRGQMSLWCVKSFASFDMCFYHGTYEHQMTPSSLSTALLKSLMQTYYSCDFCFCYPPRPNSLSLTDKASLTQCKGMDYTQCVILFLMFSLWNSAHLPFVFILSHAFQ